jgi:thiamine-phosphate pyrophosphorylase
VTLPSALLLITDRSAARMPLLEIVSAALASGCRWVLVREKDLPNAKLVRLVQQIMAVAKPYGATVSISGNPAVASFCNAQALHLPNGASLLTAREILGEKMLIGVSAHSMREAQQAAQAGADYVTLSPIFLTASKPGYGPALGLDKLHSVALALPIPVIALGGVIPDNAGQCLHAGAAGVAMMGTIMRAARPRQIVKTILQDLKTHKDNEYAQRDQGTDTGSNRIR